MPGIASGMIGFCDHPMLTVVLSIAVNISLFMVFFSSIYSVTNVSFYYCFVAFLLTLFYRLNFFEYFCINIVNHSIALLNWI